MASESKTRQNPGPPEVLPGPPGEERSAAVATGGTIMAFDFGLKRIGVAIGETLLASARPLTIIEDEVNERRFAVIGKLIAEWQPARLVVGLPRHVDGSEHAFAAR